MKADDEQPPRGPGSLRLGPLEWRVLDALWAEPGAMSVRDLTPRFPEIAYTTLLTTLDRLHRKQLLDRVLDGRAFRYRPRHSRAQFQSAQATIAFRHALQAGSETRDLLLSAVVDAVSDQDRELLDDLEARVRMRQRELQSSEEPDRDL